MQSCRADRDCPPDMVITVCSGNLPSPISLWRTRASSDFRDFVVVDFRGDGLVPLVDGALPVSGGEFQAPGLLIQVAEMILHRGISANVLRRLESGSLRPDRTCPSEVGPAQRVEIGSVGRIQINGLLDQGQRFVELQVRGRPACSRDNSGAAFCGSWPGLYGTGLPPGRISSAALGRSPQEVHVLFVFLLVREPSALLSASSASGQRFSRRYIWARVI